MSVRQHEVRKVTRTLWLRTALVCVVMVTATGWWIHRHAPADAGKYAASGETASASTSTAMTDTVARMQAHPNLDIPVRIQPVTVNNPHPEAMPDWAMGAIANALVQNVTRTCVQQAYVARNVNGGMESCMHVVLPARIRDVAAQPDARPSGVTPEAFASALQARADVLATRLIAEYRLIEEQRRVARQAVDTSRSRERSLAR